jgi:DNA-binding NtrC family response regulator
MDAPEMEEMNAADRNTILIVDDERTIRLAMKRVFEREGYRTALASDGREAIRSIGREEPSVVFLDVAMPGMDGLETLQRIKEMRAHLPVVIMTGFGSMETAIRAVQLGAYDYITKPLDLNQVRTITRRAMETVRLKDEIRSLKTRLDHGAPPEDRFRIVGEDPKMQAVYKVIGTVTTTPNTTNVLITGESGTGKELVARAIHNSGPSRDEPFVAVNCTVLPETLLESELFGHERGAFTGATERKLGKFEAARAGTIFLDEIGDISVSLQKKLLRVLQEREFERLGGNELIPVRARFVASTNRDLEAEVSAGGFREDLYYRLNVISIRLPPLRERREDIPLLCEHFLRKYNRRFGKSIEGISAEVMDRLMASPFPGNIRELENIIERGVAMEPGNMLLPSSLPASMRTGAGREGGVPIPVTSLVLEEARRDVLRLFEARYLEELLRATRGNVSKAAEKAGVDRRTIQRMAKRAGIRAADFREPPA